eukprot:TRINITY_DN10290_c0_g1_i1.p1 TRINITY_DN10290_c0_g1~~TRINITY_DN10290_c0_g1_i1.p1  ORF type:complete len:353 (-),score=61.01 TRINITY_DN10290_c0_g1_i1:31-1089(-)
MGCICSSKVSKVSKYITSNDRDSFPKNDEDLFKLLLLGSGDSGKSTFRNQIVHNFINENFSEKMLKKYALILKSDVLVNMQKVLWRIEENDMQELLSPESKQCFDFVVEANNLNCEIAGKVHYLWKKEILVKSTAERHIGLDSQYEFYFDHALRIGHPTFLPDVEDVLKARIKTTGFSETDFSMYGNKFKLIDVGGQRSERRKWFSKINSDITAVLYLIAVDEFDKVLEEDFRVNRFDDSLELFEQISSSNWFKDIPFILFLNKTDLLKKKISENPEAMYHRFSDDENMNMEISSNYGESLGYLENQIENVYGSSRELYTYPMCAIDIECSRNVFKATQDVILRLELGMINM